MTKIKKVEIGNCVLYLGDNKDVLPEIEGVHACVTDPPYHLTSIVKRFGAENYVSASVGFMGQQWDGGDIAFRQETWELVSNSLLPGTHLLAFSGTRTYHRMACAIEDAGFEIRDMIEWVYGSGFPKSHNISKKGAKQWEGWGTALKPAQEPIAVARKPISEKTVAANVLEHGTGALNIDECRVSIDDINGQSWGMTKNTNDTPQVVNPEGRWPANFIHDGSDEVLELFPDSKGAMGNVKGTEKPKQGTRCYGDYGLRPAQKIRGDSGSAARFFYCAKTSKSERGAFNDHPTVKPITLMSYLVRLITPPKGIVLDPFMGSGSTALACIQDGFHFIGIEREEKYFDIACKRIEKMIKENKQKTQTHKLFSTEV